jgi:hypothetical protein
MGKVLEKFKKASDDLEGGGSALGGIVATREISRGMDS